MTIAASVILGLIEGITEFLPISSTAHLILTSHLLQLQQTEFLKTFEVVIQLGAILAALVLYGRTLLVDRRVLLRVLAAFIPTAIIGFALHDIIKSVLFESTQTILWTMFIGGIVLIIFELLHSEKEDALQDVALMSYPQAIGIGLFQSLAIVPGVSRAAATIIGGLLLGFKRRTIVDFSFLLAIPTMAAASGLDLLKTAPAFTAAEFLMLVIGFIASFITALLAIRWLLTFIKHHTFISFGIYRIVIALLIAWGISR